MRAFAVFMMIQGHTVDTFLSNAARSHDSFFYMTWYTMRGFTAPIFMFTAGVVFTYLLKIDRYKITDNPRIKKGIKRGFTLIVIGYLLRYPTARIFNFSYVTPEKWKVFFTVDALHLIGFGLLFIIGLVFISQKIRIKFSIVTLFVILLLFLITPVIKNISFINYMPEYFAAYFNNKTGSHFPFFPWLIYIFSGAVLGYYLSTKGDIYKKKKFSYQLGSLGIIMITMFFIISYFHDIFYNGKSIWLSSFSIISLRLGYVILLNGIVSLLVHKIKTIPNIIIKTGRHTLILYAVHLVMLYGSAWSLGLNYLYERSFSTSETILVTITMISLMLLLVIAIEKIKSLRTIKLAIKNV